MPVGAEKACCEPMTPIPRHGNANHGPKMNRCNTKPEIFRAHSVLGGRDYHVDTTSGIRLLQWDCAITSMCYCRASLFGDDSDDDLFKPKK